MHLVRNILNQMIINVAWLAAEFLGWPAALAVLPPTLRGKVAIVSGANSGIGLETTKALVKQGATVVMACRNMDKARAAVDDIIAAQGEYVKERLIPMHLDLEDFTSIKRFANDFKAKGLPLHILVSNAGIHLFPPGMASHGFERTMASDYFGHAYLIELLLDNLKKSAPSR
jgi:NAD(P)-dependent dehydrogenase (short-subunit alcohol dehydrogenase family)